MPIKWGQNFLQDKKTAQRIIQSADLKNKENIIEIGPGQGILTEFLLKSKARVIAIEIDKNLANQLKKTFQSAIQSKQLILINDDILKINLLKLLKQYQVKNYKIVANIPYYITAKVIRLFLETRYPPQKMVLLVQKEVAEKIIAPAGKTSLLTLSVQYYAQPQLLEIIPASAFSPSPKVDSAIIKMEIKEKFLNLSHKEYEKAREKTRYFFRLARSGMASRRKTLLNNLSNSLHLNKKIVEKVLKKSGLNPNIRAQELTLNNWKRLGEKLKIYYKL